MNLNFNQELTAGYKSKSQMARVLTEDWVERNAYCLSCGNGSLISMKNNLPVADFLCENCHEQYELKSIKKKFGRTVSDGTYATMIERIQSNDNPNFFFLTYEQGWSVKDLMVIPKQFFRPELIYKRPPLKKPTRRAGWVGCNIDISKISASGKVFCD